MSKTSLAAPSFGASSEGLACIRYLKKGGNNRAGNVLIKALTGALGAGTVAGMIVTGPTIVLPLIIGIVGVPITGVSGVAAYEVSSKRKRKVKMGKLLEGAYFVTGLQEGTLKAKSKAFIQLLDYRDKKMQPKTSSEQISVEQLAEKLAMMNEAGFFCRAKVFTPTLRLFRLMSET